MTPLAKLKLAVSVRGKVAFDAADAEWLLTHILELEAALSAPIVKREATTKEIAKRLVLLKVARPEPDGAA